MHTPGFQNSSAKTTRLADVKVNPVLAAVIDSTATRTLSLIWKLSHNFFRSSEETDPSIRI